MSKKARVGEIRIFSTCDHGIDISAIKHGMGPEQNVSSITVRHHCDVCGAPCNIQTADGVELFKISKSE